MTVNNRKITTVKAMSFRQMVSKLMADSKTINDPVVSIKNFTRKRL